MAVLVFVVVTIASLTHGRYIASYATTRLIDTDVLASHV